MLEMAAIKRSTQNKVERSNNSTTVWKKSGLHQEVQTSPDSVPSTPGSVGFILDSERPQVIETHALSPIVIHL